MHFSLPAGKSRSSWLDRLRTARGFSDSDIAVDPEKFLKNPNPPNDESLNPKPNLDIKSYPNGTEEKQFFSIMTDVLNELFNFGDNCTKSTKFRKAARKQSNPRICVCSNNSSQGGSNADKVTLLRSGNSNCGVDKVDSKGEGIEREGSLGGFSRTEVTVIDTSYESWKFEKLLYRKKNVWEVRDKKGKSEIVGNKKKKKRKKRMKMNCEVEVDRHLVKKLKNDKEVRAEEYELSPNDVNISEVHEKAAKTLKKNLNLENGSSSVILIKSIHAGKRNGTNLSKNSLKAKQKQPVQLFRSDC